MKSMIKKDKVEKILGDLFQEVSKQMIDNKTKDEFHLKFQEDLKELLAILDNPLWEVSINFFIEKEKGKWLEERERMAKLLFKKGIKSW